jgi:hypothetical protein
VYPLLEAIVHTFSPTSTRYLHNIGHFLYNVQVHFLDYTLLMLYLLNFFQDLKSLMVREHYPLPWDERYAPYLARAGFLDIALVVIRGLSTMDGPLLLALVDRWRPETHSFHLPCGKMTVVMQDTTMILGLPLEGLPVSGIIQSAGWCDMVELHIGVRPPDAEEGDASKKTSGVNTVSLRQHFTVCPQGATEAVVERHARVWI